MIDFLLGQEGHATFVAFSAAGLDRSDGSRRKDGHGRR